MLELHAWLQHQRDVGKAAPDIHASTVNTDAQRRMCLSTDVRYQLMREKIDQRWAQDYSADDNR